MVKKLTALFIFFLLVAGFIFVPGNLIAEEESSSPQTKIDFDKSYSEYVVKREEYKKAHSLYVSAKAQYLRSRTQKSETALMDAGNSVLKLRDEVITYYLDAILKKYKDTDGATDEITNRLQTKVDEEVKWYEQHILSLPTSSTLEDLTEDSDKAEGRKRTSTDRLSYEILLNISYATTVDYSSRFSDLLTEFVQKFDIIRAETREEYAFDAKKVQLIDKYIDEMEIISERSADKREEIYQEINRSRVKTEDDYNVVLKSLIEATQYDKDATFKLIETIAEVKTKNID